MLETIFLRGIKMISSISFQDYFMDRDVKYAGELTDEYRENAAKTVARWNLLLAAAASDGVFATIDSVTRTLVGSGWRPLAVNESTPNAAKASKHTLCQACDVRDSHTSRALARWALLQTEDRLNTFGLWFERPQWTPTWLHGQIVAPASGHRFFVPSSSPPMTAALPGEINRA